MTGPGSVVVRQGDVVVEKSFDPEGYPVPAIEYVVRTERDETAAVRLVDTVPEDVSPRDLGFHPEYGGEFWTTEDDRRIVFEREFRPGEEYTTVYGVRAADTDDIDHFLTEPAVQADTPADQASVESEDVAAAASTSGDDGELPSVVAERGGIVVEKFYDPEGFPVPAVVFLLASERDDHAAVRLVDRLPDGVSTRAIGFHPEHGADCWTVTGDGRLVFERELQPGGEYVTLYGVQAESVDEVEALLAEPSIETAAGAQPQHGTGRTAPPESDSTTTATDDDGASADGADATGAGADSGREAVRDGPTAGEGGDPDPRPGTGAASGAGGLDDGPVTGSGEHTDSIEASYGAFELVEPLGGGGFADVHLARYEGREVALKEPRFGTDATLSRELVEQFVEEAEHWTAVDDHPNVVSVLDHGVHGGLPWLALEYVPGGDLSTVVGDLPVGEAAAVGVGIARAVRYAHRHSVSHLDLKPGNVLLDPTGEVPTPKVTDWGLSRTLLDETGTMEGLSVAYAAPEQFDGGSPDDFTDIYQLGALLFELFTGEPPYDGPPMAVLREKGDDPPQPTAVDPSLPDAVDDIVGRAMAAEKSDRFETVVDLRRDLAALRERM